MTPFLPPVPTPMISQDHISTMELESTPSVSDSEGESP